MWITLLVKGNNAYGDNLSPYNDSSAEGNETVTICHQLKMPASDGKMRMTDVLSAKWGTICTPVAMLCQDGKNGNRIAYYNQKR